MLKEKSATRKEIFQRIESERAKWIASRHPLWSLIFADLFGKWARSRLEGEVEDAVSSMISLVVAGVKFLEAQGYRLRYIFESIEAERARQIAKWGDQSYRPDSEWALILGEEIGEWMRDCLDLETDHAVEEMTQVVTVGVAWLEARMKQREKKDEGAA